MVDRRKRQTYRRSWIRRGAGLGLSLWGLWMVGTTGDFGPVWEGVKGWLIRPAAAVSLMAGQMGMPVKAASQVGLEGLSYLLVQQSALLSAGEGFVAQKREQEGLLPPPQELPLSPPSSGEDSVRQPEPPLSPLPPEEMDPVMEMTGIGKEGGNYLQKEGVYLYNRSNKSLDPSIFTAGQVALHLGDGPQILILHSHGTEAYSQNDGDRYEESDAHRTTDCTHNIVRIGEELAQVFRDYGFEVIHDTSLHDYPSYNSSYENSKLAVQKWLKEYPTIQIVFDVHRDALVGDNGEIYKLVSQENGEKVAQVMLVVGTDGGGGNHPRWTDNLALAIQIQRELIADYVTLARPIVLRNSTYNQQYAPGYLLLEVGGHGNTLSEAIAGARLFAHSASQVLLGLSSTSAGS